MVNYGNSKIYKIEPVCEHDKGDIYVGSTTKQYLSQRFVQHRSDYKGWKENKKKSFTSSFILFEKYGVDNCKIILIEYFPCNTHDELLSKEGEHIRSNECVNKIVAGRTFKEYYEDNKDNISLYNKEYAMRNKEILSQKQKIYSEQNRDKIKEYKKQYLEKNKEMINEKDKERYRENKEIINQKASQKVMCECGCQVRISDIARHKKSKKHLNLLSVEN